MNTFRYKAVQASGEVVEGNLEAADRGAAISQLSDMGFFPIRADQVRRSSIGGFLNADVGALLGGGSAPRHIMIVTRELATLLDAGVELERALEIIVDLADRPAMRKLFEAVLNDVRGGANLSDALEAHPAYFAPSYVSMVRAGEAGGALDAVFERIADFLERAHAARENLRSALIYPIILLVMAVLAVAVMVGIVLPQFEPLFSNAGKELPWLTRVMLGASDFVAAYGWTILAVIAGAVILFRLRLRNTEARIAWHRWMLSVPLIGQLILKNDVARLTRTLGTLLQNGVATLSAMAIVCETVGNRYLAQGIEGAAERVKSGTTISDALSAVHRFPNLASHLVRVGEETGHLEDMLARTAIIFEDDARRTTQRLLALLLPGLTALIGLFIAAIIASIFLAIVNINQLAF